MQESVQAELQGLVVAQLEEMRASQLALLRAEQEQASLLRAELRGLVASQIEELVAAQLKMQACVQGLMERFGSLMERAEAAIERFSLLPVVNVGCEDGGLELFGCYSPRDVTDPVLARNSTSTFVAAAEHVSPAVQGPPVQDLGVEMFVPMALKELRATDAASPEEKIAKVMAQFDVIEPQEKTMPFSMADLCREIVDMPKDKQVREDAPSLAERRSIRLDKKNKDCVIPPAKRAEFRRAEAYGENPKLKSKGKDTEEVLDEKMQSYLQLYKKQHTPVTPQVMEAVRALVASNA